MSWAPGAGFEPASMTMDSRRLYQLSYPGAVQNMKPVRAIGRKALLTRVFVGQAAEGSAAPAMLTPEPPLAASV